jgi:CheY-like chemotaxis protein
LNKKYTILFVEDEEAICSSMTLLLSKNEKYHAIGYHVNENLDPHKLTKDFGTCIDVLIADYYIPGCDGITLIETFKETPNNKIKVYSTNSKKY